MQSGVPVAGEPSRRLLHKAAAHGHLALVNRMIDKGVNVSSFNDDEGTFCTRLTNRSLMSLRMKAT